MTNPTHADLVKIAAEWLRKKNDCTVVLTELFSLNFIDQIRGEQPDAIGWRGPLSILVECKVSRHDFFDNHKKDMGSGSGYQRYFLTPENLVKPEEVPTDWGLLEYNGTKVNIVIPAPRRTPYAVFHEMSLLLTAIRCMHPSGIKVTRYNEGVNRATMGIDPILEAEIEEVHTKFCAD